MVAGVVVVVMAVVVVVVMVVMAVRAVAVSAAPGAGAQPRAQHRRADADDEQPRDERQPRVELSGTMNCESASVTSPSAKTPAVCVDRHGRAEQERVARLALRADEVAGHERLAVPRRERVGSAPERGDQQREQDHAEREVAALDERLEAAVCDAPGPACDPDRRAPGPSRVPGRVGDRGAADVERRAQEALRVGAELVASGSSPARSSSATLRAARARVTTISRQPIRLA